MLLWLVRQKKICVLWMRRLVLLFLRTLKLKELLEDMALEMGQFRIHCCKANKNYIQPYLFCCIQLPQEKKNHQRRDKNMELVCLM